MPDILSSGRVNCVFGNIGSVIANALQAAANKNQIQVTTQLIRILRHALDQFMTGRAVQVIQLLVTRNHCAPQLDVLAREGIHIAWSYIGRINSTSGRGGCRFSFRARRAIVVA